MIRALIFVFFFALTGCTSNESTVITKANLTKDVVIDVPLPSFSGDVKYKQLLTTTYDEKKRSLIVFLNLYKDKLELTGVSTGFINIFKLVYDKNGVNTQYYVPKTLAPPVNQVLLDIMLCYSKSDEIKKILNERFILEDLDTMRLIKKANSDLVYKIDYQLKDNKRIPLRIENKEFNYNLNIKYL